MKKYQKIIGFFSLAFAIATLIIPLVIVRDIDAATNLNYLGFFFATYIGYGVFLIPFLIKTLDPILIILIGAFGVTIDEFFAWYAGKAAIELDKGKKWHTKIHNMVDKYGLYAVFALGLMPLPGFVYAISGFAVGHHQIPFSKFFAINFSAKLIRTTVIVVGALLVF